MLSCTVESPAGMTHTRLPECSFTLLHFTLDTLYTYASSCTKLQGQQCNCYVLLKNDPLLATDCSR